MQIILKGYFSELHQINFKRKVFGKSTLSLKVEYIY
jgi:hypothetical protein